MVGTLAKAIAQPDPLKTGLLKVWSLKSQDFPCFLISNGWISDPHCTVGIQILNSWIPEMFKVGWQMVGTSTYSKHNTIWILAI